MIRNRLGILALFFSISSMAASVPSAVYGTIQHAKYAKLSNANYGIVVTSMRSGRVLYGRNMNHLYTPASVQKLFTAAAALSYLKPKFQFITGLYTKGVVHNSVLNGDLYIKFSGDPSLTSEDLNHMMDELHDMGVRKIQGHVYVDNFDFGNVPYPPGFLWDDLSYSFAAPMNAIIIDENKFALTFTPSKYIGHSPKLTIDLPPNIVKFTNNMHTTTHYSENCPITIYSDMNNNYKVGGCLDKHAGVQSRSLAVRDMVKYAESNIDDMLAVRHIAYLGNISRKQMPNKPVPLVVHASASLNTIVRHMLKKSDDLYANAIFKKIGESYYKKTGSWQNSLSALKNILGEPAAINFKKNLLTDGAGLSRYNLITPRQLSRLLFYVYHNTPVKKPLMTALPIAGWDGTLAFRMLKEGKSKRIHAKTGSMTGVSTLAGYIRTANRGTLGFVIMVNDFVGKRIPYIEFENQLCEALARI